MRIGLFRHIIALGLLLPAWGLALPIGVAAQAGGDWPIYGGSYANTRRSELTQVNSSNVRQLRLAWNQVRQAHAGEIAGFGHHGAATVFTASDVAGRLCRSSGITSSRRSAPRITCANTGAETLPPM